MVSSTVGSSGTRLLLPSLLWPLDSKNDRKRSRTSPPDCSHTHTQQQQQPKGGQGWGGWVGVGCVCEGGGVAWVLPCCPTTCHGVHGGGWCCNLRWARRAARSVGVGEAEIRVPTHYHLMNNYHDGLHEYGSVLTMRKALLFCLHV